MGPAPVARMTSAHIEARPCPYPPPSHSPSAPLRAALRHGARALVEAGATLAVWLVGIGGVFGYLALYFAAYFALVAYLWPLLIVLFSTALPGDRLRAQCRRRVGRVIGWVARVHAPKEADAARRRRTQASLIVDFGFNT